MSHPWQFYAKVSGACLLVGSVAFVDTSRCGLVVEQDVECILQLGAGMEGFMIKTGFYNKCGLSQLLLHQAFVTRDERLIHLQGDRDRGRAIRRNT